MAHTNSPHTTPAPRDVRPSDERGRFILEISDVYKSYPMGEAVVRALNGVSLKIERGDFVAIMGPSGSGKSTLMHVLGLLDTPDRGSYRLAGQEVASMDQDRLADLRSRTIGFVFQQFNLLPRTSAADNVALPLLYSGGNRGMSPEELLEEVGLGNRTRHFPNELSGGQQQRVAIARALVNGPEIILADEPTGNLDSASEKEILALLTRLNEKGITVIIVTHEEGIARAARRVIRMRDGVVQSDTRNSSILNVDLEPRTELPAEPERKKVVLERFLRNQLAHATQGLKALSANKVRSGLSMLGILIGVAAVVAILAIGQGSQGQHRKKSLFPWNESARHDAWFFPTMGVALEAGTVTASRWKTLRRSRSLYRG